jgi:nucleoside-diphosphate-sugar epimerase
MATLVTGGGGFIGLAIAERLIAGGEKVALFDLAAPADDIRARPELTGARLISGDVRRAEDVDRALAAGSIDRVIHAAAVTPNAQRERDEPGRIVDINIGGTVNLLERVSLWPAIRRVIVLSSVAVYGFSKPATSGMFEEDASPPAPASLYGITKLAAEQAALRIAQLRSLDVRVARLGPVFGAWENPTTERDALSPHHQIMSMALQRREVQLSRPMTADWISSHDAAEGIVHLSHAPALRHDIYHVSGGVLTDLVQWCGAVSQLVAGFRWKSVDPEQPGSIVYGLPKDRAPLSIARLADDTGFRPSRDLDTAAREYLGWIQPGTRATVGRRKGNDL